MASATSTFDDPAENPLSEGGVWDSGPGTWEPAKKTGGTCQEATPPNTLWCARRNSPAIGSDQYSECTITTAGFCGPQTRIQGTGAGAGDCYEVEYNNGTSELKMYRIDDTGSLSFNQLGAAFAITPSVPDDLRLESSGSTHTAIFNGSSLGTRTDSTYTGGQPGLGGFGGAQFTSWGGGDLAGGGGGTTLRPSTRMLLGVGR